MKIIAFLFLVLFVPLVYSQEYFQQQVNYRIQVSLNDENHSLSGFETIEYINHSPDELNFIYFHLWPNAYKNIKTAFAQQQIENGSDEFYYSDESEKGFIDSLDFRVNGTPARLVFEEDIDICKIILSTPLKSGETAHITTPFYVKIPGSFSRFGHVGQSYQITQWYPKPAVYDREGWHPIPYLDQGEFYSEFGSYDVTITLPSSYVVGATGNLVTQTEYEWLTKLASEAGVDSIPGNTYKTIQYKEDNIHDFAWFADKKYKVLKGEVSLSNSHKVTTWAMFTPGKADRWKNAITFINDAVKYYSDWYGNYPYNNCTAVSGSIEAGGAMEYPTITVVGDAGTEIMLENFIMHEVGHNWFYGILGFNERKYPYLDEGFNSFSEFRYTRKKYPDLKLYKLLTSNEKLSKLANIEDLGNSEYYYLTANIFARTNTDQILTLESKDYTMMNYGSVVYYKSALVFTYLLQYLGEEKFDSIMHDFYKKWQFKHPGPKEFRMAFTENSGADLNWLFDDLMQTRDRIDYAIRKMEDGKVLVKNRGDIASPVNITAYNNDIKTSSSWHPGFKGSQWLNFEGNANHVNLFDSVYLPEIQRKNNNIQATGLCKTRNKLEINLIQLLEKPDKTQLGIFPVAGWNNYDKTMLGVVFYNPLIPQQKIDYQLMPMIGLNHPSFAGMGHVSVNFFPASGFIQSLTVSLDGRRFGTNGSDSYNKAGGGISFTLRNAFARSPMKKTFEIISFTADEPGSFTHNEFFKNYFLIVNAGIQSNHVLHPYNIKVSLENSNNFTKTSLTFNLSKSLSYAKNALQLRFYAAGILAKNGLFEDLYALKLSGNSGIEDYRYENLYFGRFEDPMFAPKLRLMKQQFVLNEGGFVSYNPFATTDEWMTTATLTARIPKMPFSVFATAGSYGHAGDYMIFQTEEKTVFSEILPWEVGGVLNIAGFLKIYFPFTASADITEVNDYITENYWQRIRYSLNLNALNPFKLKNSLF